MGRNRVTTAELARLLNSTAEPIYVLDDELTIVFCNRACLDWLGPAAEGLLARRCAYHSSPDAIGPDAVAARLCPPAAAMAGRPATATVSCLRGDGRAAYRRARFLPLQGASDTADMLGLVAILDREDAEGASAEADASVPSVHEAESPELHEQIRAFRRQAAGRYRANRLLGTSPALRKARRQVELAATGRGSVLLVGPPGSGRQHTAAAIHYGSGASARGSLIPLACSVLGPELIRSTLSALASGHSLGEASGNSALLLNEVDQLPREVQQELVALLVDRPFPLRLIATAGQPLEPLVRQAAYCEQLAAALGTITIELPALCDRREDIPLLAQAFLEEINAEGAKQVGGFTPAALDALDGYAWPGNVDELAQVVAQSHGRASSAEIDVADLPERIHLASDAAAHPRRREETIVLDDFLEEIERELIGRAMAEAKDNKTKAARLLGITRPRLYRRLVQLGFESPGED